MQVAATFCALRQHEQIFGPMGHIGHMAHCSASAMVVRGPHE